MTDAFNIKLSNNTARIIDAITLDKNLFPTNTRLSNPCSVCNRNCLENQASLHCDSCDKWCHRICDGMKLEQYNQLKLTIGDPNKNGNVYTVL